MTARASEFNQLRPRLKALLELHRTASTDDARLLLAGQFEQMFLATAWHVARDLLANGWTPGFAAPVAARRLPPAVKGDHLRLVKNDDAA